MQNSNSCHPKSKALKYLHLITLKAFKMSCIIVFNVGVLLFFFLFITSKLFLNTSRLSDRHVHHGLSKLLKPLGYKQRLSLQG